LNPYNRITLSKNRRRPKASNCVNQAGAVPYRVAASQPGDIAACYADPILAKTLLHWQAQLGLAEMCADHWRWQSQNPDGFTQRE